jgi:glycosidase
MMNLVGSHDTPRYLTSIGGNRARQKLTALFAMTYVGAPHVYYGDEIAMEGGADPDCRRPFDWRWKDEAARKEMHDWYRSLIRLRNGNAALSVGDFTTLVVQGKTYAYARRHEGVVFVVVLNAGDAPAEVEVPLEELKLPAGAAFEDALTGAKVAVDGAVLRLTR